MREQLILRQEVEVELPPLEQYRPMTAMEYNALSMIIPGDLKYDRYTHTFRGVSPEGSTYTYSRCIDADTFKKGEGIIVRERERKHFGHNGKTNSVSMKRMGIIND